MGLINHRFKSIIIGLAVAIGVLALMGCGSDSTDPATAVSPAATSPPPAATSVPPAATPVPPVPSTDAPTAVPSTEPRPTLTLAPRQLQVLLEGDGSEVVGPYEMGQGVIIAFVRYEGDGPFSMTFVDETQAFVKSIESSPGPYAGERVHSVFTGNDGGLAPGNYMVDVKGNGPWRIRLFQERAFRGQLPEITLTGTGDGGGSWLQLEEGEYTMTTSHTGSADFIVELFDNKGLSPFQIVKAMGNHEGQVEFTVGGGAPGENPQAGIYAMGVLSRGDWSVTITNDDAP